MCLHPTSDIGCVYVILKARAYALPQIILHQLKIYSALRRQIAWVSKNIGFNYEQHTTFGRYLSNIHVAIESASVSNQNKREIDLQDTASFGPNIHTSVHSRVTRDRLQQNQPP